MNFELQNKSEKNVSLDTYQRAFKYGAAELGIDGFKATVACLLVKEFPNHPNILGLARGDYSDGVVIALIPNKVCSLQTFFEELTHAQQYLTGDLVRRKRSVLWKGESYPFNKSWQDKVYEISPWEQEAKDRSVVLFDGFLKREVHRLLDGSVNCYDAVGQLKCCFGEEDIFKHTSAYYQKQIEHK